MIELKRSLSSRKPFTPKLFKFHVFCWKSTLCFNLASTTNKKLVACSSKPYSDVPRKSSNPLDLLWTHSKCSSCVIVTPTTSYPFEAKGKEKANGSTARWEKHSSFVSSASSDKVFETQSSTTTTSSDLLTLPHNLTKSKLADFALPQPRQLHPMAKKSKSGLPPSSPLVVQGPIAPNSPISF